MRIVGYLFFGSLSTAIALGDVLTVDDSGGSDFLSIAPAVAAATPGDTILVRPGSYAGFTVDKDVRILGEGPGQPEVLGEVRIETLGPGAVVVLDRFDVRPVGNAPALRVIADQGVVHVQRSSLWGGTNYVQASPGAILSTGYVFLTDCSFRGSLAFLGTLTNSPGMRIEAADVAMDSCAVNGGIGYVEFGLFGYSIPGAAGLVMQSGLLFASNSTVTGGRGGDSPPAYSCDDPPPNAASDGGTGLVTNQPTTFIGSQVSGGAGGEGGFDACGGGGADGAPGAPYTGMPPTFLPETARVSTWSPRWWEVSSCAGSIVEVELSGEPGDQVFLAWSYRSTFNFELALRGVWLPRLPTIESTPFAVLPASGQLTATVQLPAPAAGELAADRFVQAYFVDSNGSPALGTPGSVVILPPGMPYCSVGQNSTGQSGLLEASGIASIQSGTLTLTASDVPPSQFGYFLSSGNQGLSLLPPPSQGVLCLELPIVRHGLTNTGTAGQVVMGVDLSTLPVAAGETWNFQFWFRDSNPGNTSNTTNGVAVVVCD